jgi:hypothetical protein
MHKIIILAALHVSAPNCDSGCIQMCRGFADFTAAEVVTGEPQDSHAAAAAVLIKDHKAMALATSLFNNCIWSKGE